MKHQWSKTHSAALLTSKMGSLCSEGGNKHKCAPFPFPILFEFAAVEKAVTQNQLRTVTEHTYISSVITTDTAGKKSDKIVEYMPL